MTDGVYSLVRHVRLPGVRSAAIAPLLFVMTACHDDIGTATVPVESITLTPETADVAVGASVPFTATPRDGANQVMTGLQFTWSSSNSAVASVSRAGVVVARSPGQARIAVSAMGRSATASIAVSAPPVAAIMITPAALSLQIGGKASLQARTVDADGGTLIGRTISWSSSDADVVTVTQSGVVTALAPGVATITATSEGRTAQSAVTITLPSVATVVLTPERDTIGVGAERQLKVTLRDGEGLELVGRAVTWSSSNFALANVSSTGLVVAHAPGTVMITATSEGRSGRATVVILERIASSIILTPGSGVLVVGTRQALITQITDAEGNLLQGRPVTYTSNAPAVASVAPDGVVSALAPGTARITATSEGKTGSATFTVIQVPVASVRITPSQMNLAPGAAGRLFASALSVTGEELMARSINWISGAPGVAAVEDDGRVRAVGNGVAIIVAVIDGISGSATVTVGPPAVVSIDISPADPVVDVGQSIVLDAIARDQSGRDLVDRFITWASADEQVAFVSSTGQVVGVTAGVVRITASSEGVSASTLVTVR